MKEFIKHLPKEVILKYAEKVLQEHEGLKYHDELYSIFVTHKIYHGGHYDDIAHVNFQDFSYESDIRDAGILEWGLWASYVYSNLPNDKKVEYAKGWNAFVKGNLDPRLLIIGTVKDYMLPETIEETDEIEPIV